MSHRCNVCGVEALEGQSFAEEGLPFQRKKRYCTACLARFYHRFHAVLFFAVTALVIWAIGDSWLSGRRFLASPVNWALALCVSQWVLIVPHELGHALAAKLLGYGQVRILIGSGKPLFTCRCFGIEWMFNLVPFGGLTLANPQLARGVRWREFIFVASGPAVSVLGAALAWPFIDNRALFDSTSTMLELFFWANVLVLVENLIPYVVQTAFGPLQTDGLSLWKILFQWGKPPPKGPQAVPWWNLFLSRVLKWAIVATMFLATLLFGFLIALPFTPAASSATLMAKITLVTVGLGLMLLAGWVTIRIARRPVAKVRTVSSASSGLVLFEELRARSQWVVNSKEFNEVSEYLRAQKFDEAISAIDTALKRFPDDVLLLALKGDCQCYQKNFAGAEKTYDQTLTFFGIASTSYRMLLAAKLRGVLEQGDTHRADVLCAEYLSGEANAAEKIQLVDQLVCSFLFKHPPLFLKQLENWTRKALDLAPGTLTLKGTLGGILTEQGNIFRSRTVVGRMPPQPCFARPGNSFVLPGNCCFQQTGCQASERTPEASNDTAR